VTWGAGAGAGAGADADADADADAGADADADADADMDAGVEELLDLDVVSRDTPAPGEAVEAPVAEADRARGLARQRDKGSARLVGMTLAVCGLLAAVLAMTTSAAKRDKRTAPVPGGASSARTGERPPSAVATSATTVVTNVEATGPVDGIGATAAIAASASAVAVAPTPRVRPSTPPRDPPCSNCATHPDQCGKFSLPQGRGDCYCGCSANSRCALSTGRSTGPCIPNATGTL
jgi:hypothetical protein